MTNKTHTLRQLLSVIACAIVGNNAIGQNAEVVSPCPEIIINQRVDHIPYRHYRMQGWDTVATCSAPTIELTADPYVPVQKFNGTYLVEEIPYNPPDTTFYLRGQGTRMDINSDDVFAPTHTTLDFPFYFFGIRKNQFRLGDNGMVTFVSPSDFGTGNHCPYSISASTNLPWTTQNNHPGAQASEFNRMHDAILGVYEDSHPQTNTVTYPQGIYYGVLDSFPCRKIIASWNEIPLYSAQTNNRQTYQIVCYEGSNIIEVHVKRRGCCSSTNSGRGFIGIQNATGEPQQPDPTPNTPNHWVVPNSPSAFWPTGRNNFTNTLAEVSYRFTPQGETNVINSWYVIFDDGRDSIPLTQDPLGLEDTNVYAYYSPINMVTPNDPDHPTRTTAIVRPKKSMKYVCKLQFRNAEGYAYVLFDTIRVGIDTTNTLALRTLGESYNQEHATDICQGQEVNLELTFPSTQAAQRVNYHVIRVLNGREIELPASMYNLSADLLHFTLLPDPRADTLPTNKIDTIKIQASVDFVSGCFNYDTSFIRIFPNFDTIEEAGICQGQTFVWPLNGESYTESTTAPSVHLQSQPGCDSTVHLNLTVFGVSLTIDSVEDCKPYEWLNGKTYYENNTATAAFDTIVLPNRYGCDSVVQLQFTIRPLEARIRSSLDHFDFDHLDVELTDISIGDTTRRWQFPSGVEQTGVRAYYTIPVTLDSADIRLIAYSPYGCIDTTNIVLNLNKESFWVPNIFTPDSPSGNNLFGSVSQHTTKQEMVIYNRRGELVYRCSGADCKWDGRDLNGAPCPQGAYVYVIRYTTDYDPHITQVRKGSVTLLR